MLLSKQIIIGVAIFVLVLSPSFKLFAQNASELRDKIEARSKEIEKLEAEIIAYKKNLSNLDKEANTLQGALKKLDLNRQKLNTDIKITENKIEATNLTIQKLAIDIGNKEERILNSQAGIAQGLREVQEIDSQTLVEGLLSQKSLTDAWNEFEAVRSVQKSLSVRIKELKEVKVSLEINKEEEEKAQIDLINFKSELDDREKINDQNTAEKNKLLKQTKSQEVNYKKILTDKITLKEAFEKEVENYEAQLKFILDPSKLPTGAVFSWPLDDIYITQMFGKTVDSKRLYASGSHNGTDFRASLGTSVKAMADGEVMGTGDTDKTCPGASYGKWVLIKHPNGLASLYAHLSLVKVSTGSSVNTGQIIGYSGSTGYSTGPHLHISVYAGSAVQVSTLPSKACGGRTYTMPLAATNAYLDPLAYLPSYKR